LANGFDRKLTGKHDLNTLLAHIFGMALYRGVVLKKKWGNEVEERQILDYVKRHSKLP